MTLGEPRGPVNVEAAVGRLQRRHRNALLFEQPNPGTVGAQLRPAGTAQRQHGGIGLDVLFTGVGGKTQLTGSVPAQPAVIDVQPHALFLQPAHPAAHDR